MTLEPSSTSKISIDNRSIPEHVADLVMRRILSGTYMPGDRIVESRVATEVGVAQSSVREALRKLEISGVVSHKRHVGVIVKAVDPESARIAIPIRAKIEETAMVEAMKNSIDVAPLRQMVEAMKPGIDFDAETDLHTSFHHYICEASGHKMLTELWDLTIWRTIALFLQKTTESELAIVRESHTDIVDFLEFGDPLRAPVLALQHVSGNEQPDDR